MNTPGGETSMAWPLTTTCGGCGWRGWKPAGFGLAVTAFSVAKGIFITWLTMLRLSFG
jgi:hypothetical protein